MLTGYFTNQTIPKSIQMDSKKKNYIKNKYRREDSTIKLNNREGSEMVYTLDTSETKRQKRAHTKYSRLAVRIRAKPFEKS